VRHEVSKEGSASTWPQASSSAVSSPTSSFQRQRLSVGKMFFEVWAKFETPKRPFGCFLRVPHFHNTPTEFCENEMNLSEEVGAGTK